ncbi:MAG: cytochrome P450 [Burkholderiales bacterium]
MSSQATTAELALPRDIAATIVDPKAHADLDRIHAAYTWARANNPLGIAEVDGYDPFWVVTKHADLMEISRDGEAFHNSDRSALVYPRASIEQYIKARGKPNSSDTLISLDDPEHRKLRGLTQNWFMPNNVAKLNQRVRDIAQLSVNRMLEKGGTCDFVQDVALQYPLRVVMDILGVPSTDEPLMLKLTQQIFGPQDPDMARDKNAADPVARAKMVQAIMAEIFGYFAGVTADRLKNPRDDIATVLSTAQIDGQPISDAVRNGYYLIIATAGHDTTSSSTAVAMWALARDPSLLSRLKADPTLISGLIDESIRWGSPVRHFMRAATKDVMVRNRKIAKGDWLMLCYGSANRDEEVFERPFEFDIDRKNKHLGFGYGPHVCLGQHLAKLEMRVLFEALLPRLESVELAGDLVMTAANFVSGPKRLPIRYRMK